MVSVHDMKELVSNNEWLAPWAIVESSGTCAKAEGSRFEAEP